MEYDGGLPRAEAERLAREIVGAGSKPAQIKSHPVGADPCVRPEPGQGLPKQGQTHEAGQTHGSAPTQLVLPGTDEAFRLWKQRMQQLAGTW